MPPKAAIQNASTLKLPSDAEIQIARTFDAPRALVYRAFTQADLLPKWMGPAQYRMTESMMDVRKGGKYRWAWDLGGGNLLVIHGVFLDVQPERRVVTNEWMDPYPTPAHNTMTFEETGGRTTVSILIRVADKAARDAMLATGMKDGMDLGYARLDALLKDLE